MRFPDMGKCKSNARVITGSMSEYAFSTVIKNESRNHHGRDDGVAIARVPAAGPPALSIAFPVLSSSVVKQ
jgi:hypothetical protein